MRKIFPIVVEDLMKKNKKIFCLLGDIGVFSFRNIFKNFKDRILNMSTMEQSMIGFAAGLSKAGYVPIVHTIAPFLALRALEQIKIDFVYNKLSGNIVSVGASNDYAKLGTTHHCFEDINILSNYDDINLFLPSNETEFKYLFEKFYNNNAVNYFRISEKKINFYIKSNGYLKKKNRKIKKNLKGINNILTISYEHTIIHKYGSKDEQDNFLKFDKKSIMKNINEFC